MEGSSARILYTMRILYGRMNYTVDVNGTIVRRHVDQLRSAAENIQSPPPAVLALPERPAFTGPVSPTSVTPPVASRHSMAVQVSPTSPTRHSTREQPRQSIMQHAGPPNMEPIPEESGQGLRRSE
ncbi:unnamed protein product, partial [Nesidiocoris tenuis]